jgi:ribosomal protein L40E
MSSKRKAKVRCGQCGAKNPDDVETCRLCRAVLPNAAKIREGSFNDGPSFAEGIENERAAWRNYEQGDTGGE